MLILGAPLGGVFSKTIDTINEFFCNIYVMTGKPRLGEHIATMACHKSGTTPNE